MSRTHQALAPPVFVNPATLAGDSDIPALHGGSRLRPGTFTGAIDMRFSPSRLALMAAAALTLSTAAVAVAQDSLPPPGPPPMMDGPADAPGGPDGPMMMRHHRLDPEARAQHLRDVLQLRADQDGALKAYVEAAGPKAWSKGGRKKELVDGSSKALTTPERLDRETEHLARAKARIDATRAFYAALSPGQKKAFDALGPMGGGHGPMRRVEFRHFKGGPAGLPAKPKAD
jgi:periplasmic protein CpxP/Spy